MEGPVTTGRLGAKGSSDLEEETGAVGLLVPRRMLALSVVLVLRMALLLWKALVLQRALVP